MSTVILPCPAPRSKGKPRNSIRKLDRFINLAPEEIPSLWVELSALASLAPVGQAIGAHLLRSRLLDSIPSYRLPEFLDSLSAGGIAHV